MTEPEEMGDHDFAPNADLLHPLATFHWEHCHTWRRGVWPTHCAALHDIVAILTQMLGFPDVLHVSTDLHSWTTNTLPYKDMSLTTYQSKFVAVGGRHPSTNEPTDLLFTSDTGLQWQPSLPPMPIKRSHTSSISTTSPEVLVVAGGIGSAVIELDVVEVFLGDQWSTVDPLPATCCWSHSTLHDGNLYFMGGVGQGDTVYTCSCTSLVSSCGESNNSTTTDRPLWGQFKGSGTHHGLVSWYSRLVSITDVGGGVVRAYCTMSQSWMKVTSKEDTRYGYVSSCQAAAAVLPTGDLLVADDHVYRVTLTVSSYDPDRRFMSDVLSRLEAVMGIQIVSALASLHSQLTTTSGVQLQALYNVWGHKIALSDPQTAPGQYVEEVISHWSAGYSYRPPTWRHLLEVLRDIGLVELSQQINTFMKGEMKYVNAYRHFISSKDVIELLFLKVLFVGPPRLGKTTVRRRLMGKIVDLMSAGEAEQSQPSTGAVDTGHGMIVRSLSSTTAVVTQDEWSAVESLTDEARMLFQNFMESFEKMNTPSTAQIPDVPSQSFSEASEASSTADTRQLPATPETDPMSAYRSKMNTLKADQQLKLYRDIPEVATIFKELLQSNFWKEAKNSFKAYLRMEDTGGQPELMDMLPALTVGPGLYLLFFSYEHQLKSEFNVFFQCASGKSTLPEQSSVTLEELLLSALSSISCCNASVNLMSQEEANSPDIRNILESSKSMAWHAQGQGN